MTHGQASILCELMAGYSFCGACLTDSSLVMLRNGFFVPVRIQHHHTRLDRSLDSSEILTLLQLLFVLVSEFNMRPGSKSACEAAMVRIGGSLGGFGSVVVVVAIRVIVARANNFSDEIGHIHFDVKLEKINDGMKLNVATHRKLASTESEGLSSG